MSNIATSTSASLMSSDDKAFVDEIKEMNLPNMIEAALTGLNIESRQRKSQRPLGVRLPLPGRYTQRKGKRLTADELLPLVDAWIERTDKATRFVIQGGNRYISYYLKSRNVDSFDMKVMSVSKAPLYTQLNTVLSAAERREVLSDSVIAGLGLDVGTTRREALLQLADYTPASPFSAVTNDQTLEDDLEKTVKVIDSGTVDLINKDALRMILEGTVAAKMICSGRDLAFIDDLFYRGRTLYSLAVIVDAFGGDMRRIKLTTIACDQKSTSLTSPYHDVLNQHVLYPFENSIRSEQGYWQDVGDTYIFTDMANYWEYLHSHVDQHQSNSIYKAWQEQLTQWIARYINTANDPLDYSLTLPLLWMTIYADAFHLELNIDKIIDQKGYKIGASVPFARLIDRFISQEEPVEARLTFKAQISDTLTLIDAAKHRYPDALVELVDFYLLHQQAIDYRGLDFMFEQPDEEIQSKGIYGSTSS